MEYTARRERQKGVGGGRQLKGELQMMEGIKGRKQKTVEKMNAQREVG